MSFRVVYSLEIIFIDESTKIIPFQNCQFRFPPVVSLDDIEKYELHDIDYPIEKQFYSDDNQYYTVIQNDLNKLLLKPYEPLLLYQNKNTKLFDDSNWIKNTKDYISNYKNKYKQFVINNVHEDELKYIKYIYKNEARYEL
jgi:hypothetical protein